jgi:uncharacterized protein (DUF1684 family)
MATSLDHADVLNLLDWKRGIFELYADVRASTDPQAAWQPWRTTRDEMFGSHPQSPIPEPERASFTGLEYFDYDPAARVHARVEQTTEQHYEIATSGDGTYGFTRFAIAHFELGDEQAQLELYWLDGYGGGLFVPFRDATSGRETYGAGRYLLDTVKGSDLGATPEGELVFDFNFAYNPSCSYDPAWVCPLAPPPNRLTIAIRAGELHKEEGAPDLDAPSSH